MPRVETIKQKWKMMADKWLETENVYQSAVYAGYSESYAKTDAYKILEKPCVKEYLKERLDKADSERIAKADEVLAHFTAVMRGEVLDQMGFETSVRDRNEAAKQLARRYGLDKAIESEKSEGGVKFDFKR